MEQVYAAPHYDSYFQRHFLLTNTVWNRERYLSPSAALEVLWAHLSPDFLSLRVFSSVRVRQAEELFAAGKSQEARRLLSEVDSFGQRMYDGSSTTIEKLLALAISRDANEALARFYGARSPGDEVRRAAARLLQLDEQKLNLRYSHSYFALERWGIALNVCALFGCFAGIVALLAILLLETRPSSPETETSWRRKTLCLAADFAPASLLLSCAAFLLSFQPYAHLFAQYRSSNDAFFNAQLNDGLLSLETLPRLFSPFSNPERQILFWWSVIVALGAFALFLIARAIYYPRGKPSTQV